MLTNRFMNSLRLRAILGHVTCLVYQIWQFKQMHGFEFSRLKILHQIIRIFAPKLLICNGLNFRPKTITIHFLQSSYWSRDMSIWQRKAENLRINGQKKLSLMCSNSGGGHTFDQFRVLINQPSFSENIGCRIFQLKRAQKKVELATNSEQERTFLAGELSSKRKLREHTGVILQFSSINSKIWNFAPKTSPGKYLIFCVK